MPLNVCGSNIRRILTICKMSAFLLVFLLLFFLAVVKSQCPLHTSKNLERARTLNSWQGRPLLVGMHTYWKPWFYPHIFILHIHQRSCELAKTALSRSSFTQQISRFGRNLLLVECCSLCHPLCIECLRCPVRHSRLSERLFPSFWAMMFTRQGYC